MKVVENIPMEEYNIIQKRRIGMEYFTTAEYATKWNISQRRVSLYCKTGRIEGAVYKGNMWLIPAGVEKPKDPRKKNNKEIGDC